MDLFGSHTNQNMVTSMIWLIDNSLRDNIGHYFHYANSLCQYAVKHQLEFRILGHRDISPQVTDIIPVEPVFRYTFHARFYSKFWSKNQRTTSYFDILQANLEFYRDLKTALQKRVNRDSVLFMVGTNHRQLLAWAWWLHSQHTKNSPAVILMFRLTYFDITNPRARIPRLVRLVFKTLEHLARGHRVRIVTDSERLAGEYSRLTSLPVEAFPIPHTEHVSQSMVPDVEPPRSGNVRFVALGDAREEKGFPLLVNAIRNLRDNKAMQGIQFTLQCHIGDNYHHGAMLRYRRILEEMKIANVQLITNSLDTDAYYQLLNSTDVAILPYSRKIYYARTSGPMVEAFAAAKPVIVTNDTWMSDQLQCFGAGITFQDGNAKDLARAILEARAKYSDLVARARANRSAWIDFHNPKIFFQMLMKST